MLKNILVIVFCSVFGFCDVISIDDFKADVYSKFSKGLAKKIELNLDIIGRDVEENNAYVLDGLNVVIGSFYAEDLLTSAGKEKLKETLKKYTAKKHSVDIDEVLIRSLKIVNDLELDEIIEAIKSRNLCGYSTPNGDIDEIKRQNEKTISSKFKNSNQRPIDLNSIDEF
ncbi:hypothetical protein CPIN18021_1492 [Campylobacter pinnipediorum subsp. caledonicus]|uniref:Uncharacterized protein n=1 Tax=Campylobacter pinnipediorum subsp. caledonicus TaxID=1874362 RepID=A0A1S6U962_9BACT|nr:hypothetical protein [Campylobacter pinnipediorum]AQW88276.1 hypothetical protein CPIN18021_1492 [Campylobacter pinnipediorum subsp. caledonicus]OPA70585.1 hypothetical protein BB381_04305 [Campylobacter pinnipediorum subsp. caledonicus]